MITRLLRRTSVIALAATSLTLNAQSSVDIGLFQGADGSLEVKVRPQADFDGIFSSLVFTLRYDKNSDVQLGEPSQPSDVVPYMAISRSGVLHENGNFAYQVFAGFGFQRMLQSGAHWEAGKEYTVLTVPMSGKGAVELVNDTWTAETENNANFYVSLGGKEQTGEVYRSMANVDALENSVMIQPNPNQGDFVFSFIATEAADIHVEILNTLGQRIFNEQLRGFEGSYRRNMDLRNESAGIYYLKISRGTDISIHKVVYR